MCYYGVVITENVPKYPLSALSDIDIIVVYRIPTLNICQKLFIPSGSFSIHTLIGVCICAVCVPNTMTIFTQYIERIRWDINLLLIAVLKKRFSQFLYPILPSLDTSFQSVSRFCCVIRMRGFFFRLQEEIARWFFRMKTGRGGKKSKKVANVARYFKNFPAKRGFCQRCPLPRIE